MGDFMLTLIALALVLSVVSYADSGRNTFFQNVPDQDVALLVLNQIPVEAS